MLWCHSNYLNHTSVSCEDKLVALWSTHPLTLSLQIPLFVLLSFFSFMKIRTFPFVLTYDASNVLWINMRTVDHARVYDVLREAFVAPV